MRMKQVMTTQKLVDIAFKLTSGTVTNTKSCEYGGVGAAILSKSHKIYTGISLDNACGIGFCAEHAAIAEMLKNNETEILLCVAVSKRNKILPPCGRCREMLYQINKENLKAKIVVDTDKMMTLGELFPMPWQERK
jgi:cytidine deaminase